MGNCTGNFCYVMYGERNGLAVPQGTRTGGTGNFYFFKEFPHPCHLISQNASKIIFYRIGPLLIMELNGVVSDICEERPRDADVA